MTTFEIKTNLNTAKARLKQRWAQLTDDDLHCTLGRYDGLLHRIHERTGETLAVIEKAINEACHTGAGNFSMTERTNP